MKRFLKNLFATPSHTPETARKRRALALEPLEERAMMAGNVTAGIDDGVLFIRGDTLDNAVEVVQFGNIIGVRGLDLNGTTRLNGSSFGGFQYFQSTGANTFDSIFIGLGDGNDLLRASESGESAFQFGLLDITTGAGNDQVSLTDLEVGAVLSFSRSPFGADTVTADSVTAGSFRVGDAINIDVQNVSAAGIHLAGVSNSTIAAEGLTGGLIDVYGGGGFNDISLTNVVTDPSPAVPAQTGDLRVFTYGGDDTVNISSTLPGGNRIDRDLRITSASGSNYGGADEVYVTSTEVGRELNIDTGRGAIDRAGDTVYVYDVQTGLDLRITTGDGMDQVFLYQVDVGDDAVVRTHGERDYVTFDHVVAGDYLFAELGDGNDTLSAFSNQAGRVYLSGQGGTGDHLELYDNDWLSQPIYVGFERLSDYN